MELSKERIGRLLLGQQVEISVGEPWDFSSPDGENVLKGRIARVSGGGADDPREQEAELEVTPFEAEGGHTVDRLLARARYVDSRGIIEHIADGEDAEVNMSFREQIPEEDRDPRSNQFLIGGFHLAD